MKINLDTEFSIGDEFYTPKWTGGTEKRRIRYIEVYIEHGKTQVEYKDSQRNHMFIDGHRSEFFSLTEAECLELSKHRALDYAEKEVLNYTEKLDEAKARLRELRKEAN